MVRSRMPDLSSSARWFLVWLLVLAVASMVGVHPIDSLVGGSYRHQGVLFFFTLFLVWQAIRYIKRKQQDVLSILFASGVGLESIIILIQTILNPHARPLGTLGEPNAAAGFLAVGAYWIISSKLPPWVRLLLYIGAVSAVVATLSRTGIASLAILSLGFLWIKNKKTARELTINSGTAHLARQHHLLEKDNIYGISAEEFYESFM